MTRRSLYAFLLLNVAVCLNAGGGEPAPTQSPAATGSPEKSPADKAPEKKTDAAPFDPTDQYDVQQIEGWKILVNKKFPRDQSEVYAQTRKLLEFQLYQITRKVPAAPLAKLRKITIWVEFLERHHPCMAYHPDAAWLREHDMNPAKAGCVELANAKTFLLWTHEQPWMVLHELAHGYHERYLPQGYQNPEVLTAYHHAMDNRLYDAVLHYDGKTVRAYAATNPMEYFSECSEAFFGTNDFYPFVNAELREHDPQGYELLRKVWEAE